MKTIYFTKAANEEYESWLKEDKKVVKRINKLIEAINESPFSGIGKPEALKYELSGFWSRRITKEHRLVYEVSEERIVIISCKFHYD